MDVDNRSRSEWLNLINEWIHSELDRKILVRHLLDSITFEKIGEELGIDWRTAAYHYYKAVKQLEKHS